MYLEERIAGLKRTLVHAQEKIEFLEAENAELKGRLRTEEVLLQASEKKVEELRANNKLLAERLIKLEMMK